MEMFFTAVGGSSTPAMSFRTARNSCCSVKEVQNHFDQRWSRAVRHYLQYFWYGLCLKMVKGQVEWLAYLAGVKELVDALPRLKPSGIRR